MIRTLAAAALLLAPVSAAAEALTIRQGETWLFEVKGEQPVNARRASASAKPARGQIKATLSALMGTTLTLINSGAGGYTFRAELVGTKQKAGAARTCALPGGAKPVLEFWAVKAAAVRLSRFKPASRDGSCPSP